MKTITETKVTCQACSHVWYYGKSDEAIEKAVEMQQNGKAMLCCSGCFPAAFLPNSEKTVPTKRCPNCKSEAIHKEMITHEIEE